MLDTGDPASALFFWLGGNESLTPSCVKSRLAEVASLTVIVVRPVTTTHLL